MNLVEQLRNLPYFAGLPEGELRNLCAASRQMTLRPGDVLLEEGTAAAAMYVITEGEFDITRRVGDRPVTIRMAGAGEVLGESALFEGALRTATATAVTAAKVAELPVEHFRVLLGNPGTAEMMLRTVTERLLAREDALRNAEKLAALGTLTAGLMHELNNPVAAVGRTAAHLEQLLAEERSLSRTLGEVPAAVLPPERSPRPGSALEQADRVDELTTWLERLGVEGAWEVAPALLEAGWDLPSLDRVVEAVLPAKRPPFVRLVAVRSQEAKLIEEVRMAGERISELVKSVKDYSYVDQAPVQDVDIHAGLESTLVILRSKSQGIHLVKQFASDLPSVEGFGGELNQVWTNLIGNALDEVGPGGRVTVRTRSEDGRVVVEVEDNGRGIPAEVQTRIFEPFFTTKPQGSGTGLGLPISYSIVARHGGELTVDSEPGRTIFAVRLPLRLPRRPA